MKHPTEHPNIFWCSTKNRYEVIIDSPYGPSLVFWGESITQCRLFLAQYEKDEDDERE